MSWRSGCASRRGEEEIRRPEKTSLEDLFRQVREGERNQLPIIIKGDVQGSVEALRESLLKLSSDEVEVKIVHAAVGGITKTDVDLASTANAIIIGFNVRPDTTGAPGGRAGKRGDADVSRHLRSYRGSGKGAAGHAGAGVRGSRPGPRGSPRICSKCLTWAPWPAAYVTDGKIVPGAQVRVIRDGVVVHEGEMSSLKRFKDDVREVAQGYECGIGVEKFNDLKEGDVLEAFRMEEVARQAT